MLRLLLIATLILLLFPTLYSMFKRQYLKWKTEFSGNDNDVINATLEAKEKLKSVKRQIHNAEMSAKEKAKQIAKAKKTIQ